MSKLFGFQSISCSPCQYLSARTEVTHGELPVCFSTLTCSRRSVPLFQEANDRWGDGYDDVLLKCFCLFVSTGDFYSKICVKFISHK